MEYENSIIMCIEKCPQLHMVYVRLLYFHPG